MPTAYTETIEKGISFEEFALRCARGMSYLISMRDTPLSEPIPEELPKSVYWELPIAGIKEKLKELLHLTPEEVSAKAYRSYIDRLSSIHKQKEENAQKKYLYEKMLERVEEWDPPTEKHVHLKKFMKEQITTSLYYDITECEENNVIRLTGDEWLSKEISYLNEELIRCIKNTKEAEVQRQKANKWLKELRESLTNKEEN